MRKSVVVVSSTTLTGQFAGKCVTKGVKPKRMTKLLGTGTAGGRRRCVKYHNERLRRFVGKTPRFASARRAGICAKQLVRIASNPAANYGIDIVGFSAEHLQRVRTAVVQAVSATAGGKNVDLALYVADSGGGRLDPAFAA